MRWRRVPLIDEYDISEKFPTFISPDVAAAELHPGGYYDTGFGGQGPWVNQWLSANPRPDWVTNTQNTDQVATSFGCAIIFIYYLRYQLGYSYAQIIRAGGSTLAETYATLTGKPSSKAISELGALLADHIPQGATFTVPGDNILPLYRPPEIACFGYPNQVGTPTSLGTTSFEAKICHSPEAEYSYEMFSSVTELDLTATVIGAIDATFRWFINGVELAAPSGTASQTSQLYLSVPVEITSSTPSISGDNPPPFAADLGITYIVGTLSPTQSELVLQNTDAPGNCVLTIEVKARETLVAGQPQGATTVTDPMTTLTYAMSNSWWAAMWPCLPHPVSEASTWLTALGSLVPLLNAPDPSPEQITAVSTAATGYLAALAQITGGAIGLQGDAAAVVSAARRPVQRAAPSISAGVDGGPPALAVSPRSASPRSKPSLKRTLVSPTPGAQRS